MTDSGWYVLRTKPHKENQVYSQLLSKGVETYFPRLSVKPVNPRASRIRPFFPGYMFLHIDLGNADADAILWLPGAIGLVDFGGVSPRVPDTLIRNIQARIESIERAGGLTFDGLRRGDPVRILSGPLAGYEAIFDARLSGGDRVRVLLEMLGRLTTATLDASSVVKQRAR
jgi:transcription antitermination factor NusG